MTIEAVVFDIGNVLIEWNPERFYDRTIGRERREALFAEVDLHEMNNRVDVGGDFPGIVFGTAEAFPHWADEIRMWHDNWIEMASPLIDHSVRLLRALRAKGVPVFALTNFGHGTFDYARTQYDILHEFDREYVSGRMRVVKPDPEIYARVEADSGVAPERLIFTDDNATNIAVAAGRGWRTHHFTGPKGWADRLVAERLLTETEAA